MIYHLCNAIHRSLACFLGFFMCLILVIWYESLVKGRSTEPVRAKTRRHYCQQRWIEWSPAWHIKDPKRFMIIRNSDQLVFSFQSQVWKLLVLKPGSIEKKSIRFSEGRVICHQIYKQPTCDCMEASIVHPPAYGSGVLCMD